MHPLRRLISKASRIVDRETAPPDMITDLRRNMDLLVLGSTRIWGNTRFPGPLAIDPGRVMVAARPARSTRGDWMVLRHMHSYLRKGGTVFFPIDLGDRTYSVEGYGYGESRMFHPVVNDALGLAHGKRHQASCFRHHPRYGTLLLLARALYRKRWKPITSLLWNKPTCSTRRIQDTLAAAMPIVREADSFCRERGLRFIAVVILPRKITLILREKIQRGIGADDHSLHVCIHADVFNALNETVAFASQAD